MRTTQAIRQECTTAKLSSLQHHVIRCLRQEGATSGLQLQHLCVCDGACYIHDPAECYLSSSSNSRFEPSTFACYHQPQLYQPEPHLSPYGLTARSYIKREVESMLKPV